MVRPRRLLAALGTLAAVLAVTACTGTPTPAPSPTGLNSGADCGLPDGVRQTRFGSDIGADLGGIILGTGRTGVVLAHQNGGDVCQWLDYGMVLVQRGYRVLLFDFGSFGVSFGGSSTNAQQVAAAAMVLRADGATSIVLMGASMGGTAVLIAAPTVTPAPTAVVALSAPTVFSGNALDAAPKLTMPVFYGAGDGEGSFTRMAKELYDLTPATTKKLVYGPGTFHGVELLGSGTSPLTLALADFLAANAPALPPSPTA